MSSLFGVPPPHSQSIPKNSSSDMSNSPQSTKVGGSDVYQSVSTPTQKSLFPGISAPNPTNTLHQPSVIPGVRIHGVAVPMLGFQLQIKDDSGAQVNTIIVDQHSLNARSIWFRSHFEWGRRNSQCDETANCFTLETKNLESAKIFASILEDPSHLQQAIESLKVETSIETARLCDFYLTDQKTAIDIALIKLKQAIITYLTEKADDDAVQTLFKENHLTALQTLLGTNNYTTIVKKLFKNNSLKQLRTFLETDKVDQLMHLVLGMLFEDHKLTALQECPGIGSHDYTTIVENLLEKKRRKQTLLHLKAEDKTDDVTRLFQDLNLRKTNKISEFFTQTHSKKPSNPSIQTLASIKSSYPVVTEVRIPYTSPSLDLQEVHKNDPYANVIFKGQNEKGDTFLYERQGSSQYGLTMAFTVWREKWEQSPEGVAEREIILPTSNVQAMDVFVNLLNQPSAYQEIIQEVADDSKLDNHTKLSILYEICKLALEYRHPLGDVFNENLSFDPSLNNIWEVAFDRFTTKLYQIPQPHAESREEEIKEQRRPYIFFTGLFSQLLIHPNARYLSRQYQLRIIETISSAWNKYFDEEDKKRYAFQFWSQSDPGKGGFGTYMNAIKRYLANNFDKVHIPQDPPHARMVQFLQLKLSETDEIKLLDFAIQMLKKATYTDREELWKKLIQTCPEIGNDAVFESDSILGDIRFEILDESQIDKACLLIHEQTEMDKETILKEINKIKEKFISHLRRKRTNNKEFLDKAFDAIHQGAASVL